MIKDYKKVIQKFYGLDRPVTDDELRQERENLIRKHDKGSLDDFDLRLYILLDLDKN